jgi:erythromycin esterase-like protein
MTSGVDRPTVLTRHYDAMIFVDETTRARPVEREEE